MRKLTTTFLTAITLVMALTAMPAAATPPGHNGQIVFGRDDPLLHDTVIYTINPDGTHEHQVLPFGLECPRWSPDGSAIVTCGAPDGGATLVIDPQTGTYREVPNPDPARFFMPCNLPSPDFERLACSGFGLTDPSLNGVYTVRTSDGGGLRRLTSDATVEDAPGDYSPDGTRLVYRHVGIAPPESVGLYVLKTNGTGTRKIAPCCPSPGSWSPQGNDIVFSSTEPGFRLHSTIWVVHSNGRGLHPVPIPRSFCGGPTADPDARGCADPVWSPDGKKILFRLTTPGFGEGGDLYTINADGTGLTQVTHDGDVEFPDWGTHPLAHA
jgi:Tol biopolymer transport system component